MSFLRRLLCLSFTTLLRRFYYRRTLNLTDLKFYSRLKIRFLLISLVLSNKKDVRPYMYVLHLYYPVICGQRTPRSTILCRNVVFLLAIFPSEVRLLCGTMFAYNVRRKMIRGRCPKSEWILEFRVLQVLFYRIPFSNKMKLTVWQFYEVINHIFYIYF